MKPNRTYLTLTALLGLILASFAAHAAPEAKMSDLSQACIGAEAPKALSECPGGPSTFSGDVKKRGAAFKSAPPPVSVKQRQDDLKPVNPDILRAKVAVFVEMFEKDRRIRDQNQALLDAERGNRELEITKLQLESARRYRNLADAIPQIVWTTDAAGTTTYLNRRWGELTGLPFDPRHPAPWLDAVIDTDRAACRDRFVIARADAAPFEIECRLRCGDRGVRWHLLRAVPERSSTGEIVGWLGTLTDIDELRRARTRDAGGTSTTAELTDAICRALG